MGQSKRTITTESGQTLKVDKFITFGYEKDSVAVCENNFYMKGPSEKYVFVGSINEKSRESIE